MLLSSLLSGEFIENSLPNHYDNPWGMHGHLRQARVASGHRSSKVRIQSLGAAATGDSSADRYHFRCFRVYACIRTTRILTCLIGHWADQNLPALGICRLPAVFQSKVKALDPIVGVVESKGRSQSGP